MTQPVGKITVSFPASGTRGEHKKRTSNLCEEQVVHDVLSPVRRTWSPANERDNPLKRKRWSGGSQAAWRWDQRRKKAAQLERRGRKKAEKERDEGQKKTKREKEGMPDQADERWDGTMKKAGRIIIKRQGGEITHGAALASIHAFYSLAIGYSSRGSADLVLPCLTCPMRLLSLLASFPIDLILVDPREYVCTNGLYHGLNQSRSSFVLFIPMGLASLQMCVRRKKW